MGGVTENGSELLFSSINLLGVGKSTVHFNHKSPRHYSIRSHVSLVKEQKILQLGRGVFLHTIFSANMVMFSLAFSSSFYRILLIKEICFPGRLQNVQRPDLYSLRENIREGYDDEVALNLISLAKQRMARNEVQY